MVDNQAMRIILEDFLYIKIRSTHQAARFLTTEHLKEYDIDILHPGCAKGTR